MALEYNAFYRKAGLRNPSQFIAPPKYVQSLFTLPLNSIIHFIPKEDEVAPLVESLAYQNYSRPIYILHETELVAEIGKPRIRKQILTKDINHVFISNRRFRRLYDVADRDGNKTDILTISYAFLDRGVTYLRSIYSDYYKWYNKAATVVTEIAKLASTSDRNQFMFLEMDSVVLPAKSILDMVAKNDAGVMNTKQLKIFSNNTNRWFLELWKWFSADPSKSLFNKIVPADLNKVNIVLVQGQGFVLLNLGKLNSWKLGGDPDNATKGFKPEQFQRYFFNLWNKVIATNPIEVFEDEAAKAASAKDSGLVKQKAPVEDTPNTLNTKPEGVDPATAEKTPEDNVKELAEKKLITGGKNTGMLSEENEDDFVIPADQLAKINDDIDAAIAEQERINHELIQHEEEDPLEAQDLSGDDEDEDDLVHDSDAFIPILDHITEQEDAANIVINKAASTPEESINLALDQMATAGTITAPEYRALQKLGASYKRLKAPNGDTLENFIKPTPGETKIKPQQVIPDRKTILDKSMLHTTLKDFDETYVKHQHHKNVAKMVLSTQNAKVAVTGYDHERVDEVTGSYDVYAIKLQPLDGMPSTVNLRMPVIDEDGTFTAAGVRYRMRKQQFDVPIRKVAPNRVSLTSYYGKIFIDRTEKKRGNYENWITSQVMVKALEVNSPITQIKSGNAFDPAVKCPRIYSCLGMRYIDFTFNGYTVLLDRAILLKTIPNGVLKEFEVNNLFCAGFKKTKEATTYLLVDYNNIFYERIGDALKPLGTLESLLGIDTSKKPLPYVTMKVFGADIPIGVLLAYLLGIDALLKALKVKPRHVAVGQRLNLEENEFGIIFADETLVLPNDNPYVNLVMAGFNEYHRSLRLYRYNDFNKKAVYANVLEDNKLGTRHLKELVLMQDMFIDPVCLEWLQENHKPTTFRGLLSEAIKLLLTDDHPDEVDPAFMRMRGYERFSGVVYSEMVKSVREMRSKNMKQLRTVTMNPNAVWRAIQQDSSVMPVKEINPIENLKDQESVTFSGSGGRSGRTMVSRTRKYHSNAMGVVSEATVDNGDVGVNYYLSANPQIDSLLGTTERYDPNKTGASSMFSTSVLLAPAADKDQARRANMISIQNSHVLPCTGYSQSCIRTGYEQVIPYRVDNMYCQMAKQDGKVLGISDRVLKVEYKDGSTASFEIGRRYGAAAGMTIPHDITTKFKAGDKFKADDVLSYHTGFFEEDLLNPGKVVYKGSVQANVALMEDTMTMEDATEVSPWLAEKLQTSISHVKHIRVNFDQHISNMVKIGTSVKANDIVCVIESDTTANKDYFSGDALDTLRMLNSDTPTFGLDGVVERIEIYYHGELEDMTESLRTFAKASDARLVKFRKEMGLKALTGQTDDTYSVAGERLKLDTADIKVTISTNVGASIADKIVVANQLKSTISRVMPFDITAEDGTPIHLRYSRKGVAARIVNSPDIIGTATLSMKVIAREMLKAYDK